jgi:hypothetical protein
MIDVQPYIDKLDRLRDYVSECIDGRIEQMIRVELSMYMMFEFGIIIHTPLQMAETTSNQTFDEYLKSL